MKMGPIIFAAAVLAFAYVFTPRPAEEPVAEVAPPAAETTAPARSSAWNRGETELPRHGDGHFYADIAIDNRRARMLVDTGASVVALTGADARSLGLTWRSEDIRPIARGAAGQVYGLPVTLRRVALGGIEVRDVEAVIVPEGLHVSLLGQSFLGRVGRVEIAGDRMVLGG